jgi:hypothetical protein
MSFSNPAAGAPEAAAEYTRALLELLGDRDPLEVQGRLVAEVHAAIAGLPDADLRRPERPGKWSILEVLQHLADTELVVGWRLRRILTEEEPELAGFDQDAWARDLGYRDADPEVTLSQLGVLREANLRLLRSLPEEAWERAGRHAERGRETVRRVASLAAAHDLVHLRQIERIRRAHAPAA